MCATSIEGICSSERYDGTTTMALTAKAICCHKDKPDQTLTRTQITTPSSITTRRPRPTTRSFGRTLLHREVTRARSLQRKL
jgi:hypothetical protein